MAWWRSPVKLTGTALTMMKIKKKYRGAQHRVVYPFCTFPTLGDNQKAREEAWHDDAHWRRIMKNYKKYQSTQY
jgi:hypothetical protein